MKSRPIIGRKIVAVRHTTRFDERRSKMTTEVEALILDNGDELRTHAYETENDGPVGDLLHVKKS